MASMTKMGTLSHHKGMYFLHSFYESEAEFSSIDICGERVHDLPNSCHNWVWRLCCVYHAGEVILEAV